MRKRVVVTLAAAVLVCGAGLALGAIPGVDPARTPIPTPPPNPPNLQEVDGGTAYYSRFANGLPTDPGFFPMAVWGAYNLSATNVQRYKDLGINVFDWVADPNNQAQLTNIRDAGLHAIHISQQQDRWTQGPESAGYMLYDEIDMACGPPGCNGYAQLRDILADLPDDGRARYNNWGKGIIFWQGHHRAQRWLNGDANGKFVDFSSVDIYWFTDGGVCSPGEGGRLILGQDQSLPVAQCRRAANYGYVIDKMRRLDALDGERQPIWNLVETGTPMQQGLTISPAQLKAAAWHSIIAGARGIVWFQHSFYSGGTGCGVTHYSLLDPCHAPQAAAVGEVGAQVKLLAPVLNAPSVTSEWTANANLRARVKWHDGHFYVLAASRQNAATTGTFSMPCLGDAEAVRTGGETGSVPITNGSFNDFFADGNAIHIYRIDGGSRCGL
jgi:hypothetical protein